MDHDAFKFRNDEPGISTAGFLGVLGSIALAILVAVQAFSSNRDDTMSQPIVTAPTLHMPFDPSPFILNALLVPAIDADAVPLRWVDPRPASLCGPDTKVLVDRKPLVAGALVPVTSFTFDWIADECHPFGPAGPRFNGAVRLRVFSENGEFGAMIEPSTLRVTFADDHSVPIRHGWATVGLGHTIAEHAESVRTTAD
jgi:hypothetical protein